MLRLMPLSMRKPLNSRLLGHAGRLYDEIEGMSSPPGPYPTTFLPCPTGAIHLGSLTRTRVYLRLCFYAILLLSGGSLFILAINTWNVPKVVSPMKDHHWSSFDPRLYLNSPPTMRFRDNLVDGVKYVTAWPIAGFTNQFMANVNLVYLASLSGRVPVVPSFEPSHISDKNVQRLPVSEIFDLPKLSNELRRPILEWQDLKNTSSREVDNLGCWSVFKRMTGYEHHFGSERDFTLDVSLTPIPESAKPSQTARFANIMVLASLGWSDARSLALQNNDPSPSPLQHITPPDETMLCYDNLYFVSAAAEFEWEYTWSPAWNLVGQYLRYTTPFEELARAYVSRAFGLTAAEPFPLYISVHVRHTDLKPCDGKSMEECFAPLSVHAESVEEIKAVLQTEHGVNVSRVLVTSDETSQTWWEGVRDLGWKALDHEKERTDEIYGPWYPIVLDTAALSFAKGFVGSKGSTMSLVAGKRVQYWENGPVREVRV